MNSGHAQCPGWAPSVNRGAKRVAQAMRPVRRASRRGLPRRLGSGIAGITATLHLIANSDVRRPGAAIPGGTVTRRRNRVIRNPASEQGAGLCESSPLAPHRAHDRLAVVGRDPQEIGARAAMAFNSVLRTDAALAFGLIAVVGGRCAALVVIAAAPTANGKRDALNGPPNRRKH